MKSIPDSARISVDRSIRTGPPLSHDKIGIFNSGLVPLATYRRDAQFFGRVRPQHLRVDLGWGWGEDEDPRSQEVVERVDGGVRYHFDEDNRLVRLLVDSDVRPYWSYSYVPKALRSPGEDWRTFPRDDSEWTNLVRAYVQSAKELGLPVGYHEVYNEPDLRDERTGAPIFYAGTLEDYLDLYKATSRAIKEADPDALVGGPSLAMLSANSHWIQRFLTFVEREHLPLDFVSFHHYGNQSIDWSLEKMQALMAEFEWTKDVELHLNEYNSFPIDYPRGGVQDGHFLASAFAADVAKFIDTPRLTRVSWAQFFDSGHGNYSGMVDIEGRAKPVFYAYEFYQNMPIDRLLVTVEGPAGVGALASGDETRVDVLAWNRSTSSVAVELSVTGVGSGELMLIDEDRAGAVREPVGVVDGEIHLTLAAGATLGFTSAATAPVRLRRRVERVVRQGTTGGSSSWIDVDEETGTIRFGTGDEAASSLKATILLRDSEPLEPITEVVYADGSPAKGAVQVESRLRDSRMEIVAELTGAPAGVIATTRWEPRR